MSQSGILNVENSNPQIPTLFVTNDGDAIPIANTLELLGEVVANAGIPFRSVGSGNTVTYQIQYANETAVSDATIVGVAAFDSGAFDVDANGFVTLLGGGVATTNIDVDASTPPGTDPVVPNGMGNITITGGQVATGTIGANVIRTNSLAANTLTVEIQRSTSAAGTNSALNGVSHFNSAEFSVDANGFVSLTGGGQAIDSVITNILGPVTPNASGEISILTSNTTVKTSGVASVLTMNFGLSNLLLGEDGSTITTGVNNVGMGVGALNSLTQGTRSVCIGTNAGDAITTGIENTAIGYGALSSSDGTRNQNTAVGKDALLGCLDAQCTAVGAYALDAGISDLSRSVAVGYAALTSLTTGVQNTAIGNNALNDCVSGTSNVAVGYRAMATATGSFNTAVGSIAGPNNFAASGSNNCWFGFDVGDLSTTAGNNCAFGYQSSSQMDTGNNNSGFGYQSLGMLTTGTDNTALGYQAGVNYTSSESSNIVIGNTGTTSESNKLRIGTQGTGTGQQDESYIAGQLNGLSGRSYKVTTPGAYPYTALKTDYVILVDTSTTRTINLIATKDNNPVYIIKDNTGSAFTNNITVSGNGSNIDGAASVAMNINYQSLTVVWNGTQWNII